MEPPTPVLSSPLHTLPPTLTGVHFPDQLQQGLTRPLNAAPTLLSSPATNPQHPQLNFSGLLREPQRAGEEAQQRQDTVCTLSGGTWSSKGAVTGGGKEGYRHGFVGQ